MAHDELNLDAVLRGYLDLKKTIASSADGTLEPRSWRLFDDIPVLEMLPVMHIGITEAKQPKLEIPAGQTATPEQLEAHYQRQLAWQNDLVAEVREVFGAIFRHSYPQMTDEELDQLFTHAERYQVVMHFFRLRFSASSSASTGSADASSASTPAAAETSSEATAERETEQMPESEPEMAAEAAEE